MNSSWSLPAGLALLALDLLPTDMVEALATMALQDGFDHPRLRQLAGGSSLGRPALDEVLTALGESGIALPSRPEAARHLAKTMSLDIVNRVVDPVEAGRDLAAIARAVGADFHELDPFIYDWSEVEGRPQDREFFRQAIVTEAKTWLESGRGSV
jgi:hypothetical protein